LTVKQAEEMQKGRAALELATQNMIPLMAIGLAGIVLCFIGALWMRKFKKDGYWMYVAGELAPVLGSFLIMGTAQFSGVMSVVAGIGIPVIFVILYTMQRKHLTK
jgi:membrane-associated phospholipid phosphatase